MDKNLSRKILFDKKAATQSPEKPKKQDKETEKPKAEPPKQPEIKFQPDSSPNAALKPISWINSHPEFKWSAMCLKIGLDKSNFKRVLDAETPVLRSEQVEKIENFLKNYGYAK
jgi:hypothetical protein